MNTQMHIPRPQHQPVNAISIDQLAVVLETPLADVKEIIKTVKEGRAGKDAYKQEIYDKTPGAAEKIISTLLIAESSHIPGGLALFVKTDGAPLLGISVLVEMEFQLLRTSSRWSFNPNPEKVS